MKKMRRHGWSMMMVVWAACVCGSCKNEVDDVFDRDATSRIEAAITECGLPLNIRGETLTLEQFAKLSDIFSDMK